jgi:hypothetical protein
MLSNNGNKSLNSFIALNECTGLNLEGTEPVKQVFGYGGTLKSNKGDPEVLLIIKFMNNVNISGIMIESSMDKSKLPTRMELFANNSSIDFSDIGSINPTETLKVENGKINTIKIAKFRNVSILTVNNFIIF